MSIYYHFLFSVPIHWLRLPLYSLVIKKQNYDNIYIITQDKEPFEYICIIGLRINLSILISRNFMVKNPRNKADLKIYKSEILFPDNI